MKLLFLACLSPKTGNCTTAERIRAHVESAGHICVLRDASEFKSSAEVAKLVTQKPPFDGALAIHLYKAGRLLLDVPVPFGVVFGGTDINEDVKVEHKLVVMKQVLLKARFAVAFTAKMKQMAYVVLRSPSSKIYVQPQGIRTEATEKFSWGEFLKSSEEVEAVAQRRAGVFLAQGRSQRELHAVVRRCFAVVNSSISEGMSAAILEAMHLEVPVVARDIPGNAAVVQHEVTGLLYSSPQEFVCQSQRLLSDGELRERLVRTAKLYVEQQHSVERERETYHRLVQSLQ
ncbi:glycosyltransferase 1 domain-containing protein 1-like isoform X3 [Gadus chalcogrammus]|uniref:glycosyltransferase 1 domain-containing protein 1-like isoform X3 n=1 Tax=Gadus chalcogrammus TaxID=1042646 RepID=UPI0024C317B5|nr:glycosyltransferase 1 domain-containing protein 1-like isoform X3 [Gadus chalcogrammus]